MATFFQVRLGRSQRWRVRKATGRRHVNKALTWPREPTRYRYILVSSRCLHELLCRILVIFLSGF